MHSVVRPSVGSRFSGRDVSLHRFSAVIVGTVMAVHAGCASVLPPEVTKQHEMKYVESTFSRELVAAGGVAVLPFLGGVGPEGIRNDAAFELAQAYRRAFPRSTVMTKDQLMRRLRPSRLDDIVVQLVTQYERTQKLDPALMLRLEQDLPVRYLVYGRLEQFSERDRGGTRRKEVVMYSELWDVPCKLMVWSGTGRHRVKELLQQDGTPMGDLFVGAATETVEAVGPSTGKKVTTKTVSC